jgi:hypothetical protein
MQLQSARKMCCPSFETDVPFRSALTPHNGGFIKNLLKFAGSDGRCNTFSNRLVQRGFSRSNYLLVLYLIRPKQGTFSLT